MSRTLRGRYQARSRPPEEWRAAKAGQAQVVWAEQVKALLPARVQDAWVRLEAQVPAGRTGPREEQQVARAEQVKALPPVRVQDAWVGPEA